MRKHEAAGGDETSRWRQSTHRHHSGTPCCRRASPSTLWGPPSKKHPSRAPLPLPCCPVLPCPNKLAKSSSARHARGSPHRLPAPRR